MDYIEERVTCSLGLNLCYNFFSNRAKKLERAAQFVPSDSALFVSVRCRLSARPGLDLAGRRSAAPHGFVVSGTLTRSVAGI